jgi:hypothetical protein
MARGTQPVTRIVPVVLLTALMVWPEVVTRAASPDDARDLGQLMASLDTLARRWDVSWTAHRWLEGELVEHGERGWMEVMSRCDRDRITHTIVSAGGSKRIRDRALSAVLQKEVENSREEEAKRAAFSLDNYRYRLVDAPWNRVRIELVPLREDARLVKGTAVVDPSSGDLLKVEGQLSQNPSFWVRDVYVSRTYARIGGATLPVDIVSTARVRLFGAARLRIKTEYLSVDGRPVDGDAAAVAQRR